MASSTSTGEHPSLRPWLIGVVVSLAVLSGIFVGLRFMSRRLRKQELWWDDWSILISMACNLVSVGLIFAMYSQGLGLASSAVPASQIVNVAKIGFAARIVFSWNFCITKMSILLMFHRYFDFSRTGRIYLVAIGAFVVLWTIISTCLFVLTCFPVEKQWQPDLPGNCMSQSGRWYANAVSTVLADLMILLLPIQQVFKKTLSRMEKLAVMLMFAQGLLYVPNLTYRLLDAHH